MQRDSEYASNQRKRDLPEGESRQGLSREPVTGLARDSGRWMPSDGTEEALTAKGDHGKATEARAARFAGPEYS